MRLVLYPYIPYTLYPYTYCHVHLLKVNYLFAFESFIYLFLMLEYKKLNSIKFYYS